MPEEEITATATEVIRPLTESARLKYVQKQFSVDESVLFEIAGADPTANKKYTQWLIKLNKKGLLLQEDLYKATQYLSTFDRAVRKNLLPGRSIKSFYRRKHGTNSRRAHFL